MSEEQAEKIIKILTDIKFSLCSLRSELKDHVRYGIPDALVGALKNPEIDLADIAAADYDD